MLVFVLYISLSLIKPFVICTDDTTPSTPTKETNNDTATPIESTKILIQESENVSSANISDSRWASINTVTSQHINSTSSISSFTSAISTLNTSIQINNPTSATSPLNQSIPINNPISTTSSLNTLILINSPTSTASTLNQSIPINNPTSATSTLNTSIQINNPTSATSTLNASIPINNLTSVTSTLNTSIPINNPTSSILNSTETNTFSYSAVYNTNITRLYSHTTTESLTESQTTQSPYSLTSSISKSIESATTAETYTSTVITATNQSIVDNGQHNSQSSSPTSTITSSPTTVTVASYSPNTQLLSTTDTTTRIDSTQFSLSSKTTTGTTLVTNTSPSIVLVPYTATTNFDIVSSTVSTFGPVTVSPVLILHEEIFSITLTNEIWLDEYRNTSSNSFKNKISEIEKRLFIELQYLHIYHVVVFDLKPGSIIANTSLTFSQFIPRCNISSSIEAIYPGSSIICKSTQSKLPTWSVILIAVLCAIMIIAGTLIVLAFMLFRHRSKTHGIYDVELCEKKNGWEYPYRYMIHQKSRL